MKLNILYAATLFLGTTVPALNAQCNSSADCQTNELCIPSSQTDCSQPATCQSNANNQLHSNGVIGWCCIDDVYCSGENCSGGVCAMPYVAPPNPCLSTNCGSGGKCVSGSATDVTCVCEATFELTEDSKGRPTCACPQGTSLNTDANRCFAPPTMAPTKAPTVAPTASPTASPTSAPTAEQKDLCEDDLTQTFALDIGKDVSCDWILKNKKRSSVRKAKYCVREEVMNMCPVSCDACSS